ncbi:MAG: CoA pyrophosphatase [Candidatus Heimdallarchaeota archaeon]|nr:CoA pyrophosphatase [Candidatus Heimdallarchaeota archaeon]
MVSISQVKSKLLERIAKKDRIILGDPTAAVLVPFFEKDNRAYLLLTKRSEKLKKHSGQISFPGGKIEKGETTEDTAIRESYEEIGIEDGDILEILGPFDDFATPYFDAVTPILSIINQKNTYVKSKEELDEILEVPLTDLMAPEVHYIKPMEFQNKTYQVHYYEWNGNGKKNIIWGATAGVIHELIEIIRS